MPVRIRTSANLSRRDRRSRRLEVRYVSVDALKISTSNARRHSAEQIRRLAASIEAFGFNIPILVDRNGRIIAGHGRLLAAKALGLRDVPVIYVEHLPGQGQLMPGTVLIREHNGQQHHVMVAESGFVWNRTTYESLSKIAFAITGTKWNGPRFFGLREKVASP